MQSILTIWSRRSVRIWLHIRKRLLIIFLPGMLSTTRISLIIFIQKAKRHQGFFQERMRTWFKHFFKKLEKLSRGSGKILLKGILVWMWKKFPLWKRRINWPKLKLVLISLQEEVLWSETTLFTKKIKMILLKQKENALKIN